MPPPPPKKPDVSVTPVPMTPSEWSPRAIPVPALGRSTADPRTPRLRELRARAAEAASLLDTRPPAWVALAYAHPDDGSPMAGAPYRARFADGSVREGRLGADGTARLDGLPPALGGTAVAVAFGDPAPAYRPLPVPEAPNPDHRGIAGLDAVVAPRVQLASAAPGADGLGGVGALPLPRSPFAGMPKEVTAATEFLWGVFAGAYKKDPTTGQLVGQILVSLVPIVGQIGALRDASAYLYRLTRPGPRTEREDVEHWIGLALSLLAVVPGIGGAAAGALRLARRAGRPVAVPLEALLGVLNRAGRGGALRFAREHLTYGAVLAAVREQLRRLVGMLDAIAEAMLRNQGLLPQEALAAAGRLQAELRLAEQKAVSGLAVAVRELVTPVDAAVRRAELALMERAVAHGATNAEVRAVAGAADPPPAGSIADEVFSGPEGLGYRSDLPKHLRGPDGFKKGGALHGTHNLDEATRALDQQGVAYTVTPTGTPGISEVRYETVNPRTGEVKIHRKTAYDPRRYSDQRMLEMAQSAGRRGFDDYLKLGDPNVREFDVLQDGVRFKVYINKLPSNGAPYVGNVHPIP